MKKSYQNPIQIKLVEKDNYEISIELDNWKVSKNITEKALEDLQNQINYASGLTKISETFNCDGENAKK